MFRSAFLAMGLGMGLQLGSLYAQPSRARLSDERPSVYAFVNAQIYVDYQTKLSHATLLIRDGKVVEVGTDLEIPPGTPTVDMKSRYLYPSFIDPYVRDLSQEDPLLGEQRRVAPHPSSPSLFSGSDPGSSPSIREGDTYSYPESFRSKTHGDGTSSALPLRAAQLRSIGFGAVASFRGKGIIRGSSTLVSLAEASSHDRVLLKNAAAHFSLDVDQNKPPTSLGKGVALLRQALIDAKWPNDSRLWSLIDPIRSALSPSLDLPQIIEVPHVYAALLAHQIGQETGTSFVIKSRGDTYQLHQAIARNEMTLIVPLNYPPPPDVKDPYEALDISLSELKHWAMAPAHAAQLHQSGIPFAFTTDGLEDLSHFLPHLRRAVRYGLPKQAALEALTHRPAEILRMQHSLGALRAGYWANFFVASDDIFKTDAHIQEHWIQGRNCLIDDHAELNLSGIYELRVGDHDYTLHIHGSGSSPRATIKGNKSDTLIYEVEFQYTAPQLRLLFYPSKGPRQYTRLGGWKEKGYLQGQGQDPSGKWVTWKAQYRGPCTEKCTPPIADSDPPLLRSSPLIYPFVAYGSKEKPEPRSYLITKATLWTNEAEGILTESDLLIQNGQIQAIGKDLVPPSGAIVIDGSAKHLTTGIIDENSRIAHFSSQTPASLNAAQIRMSDLINPKDINIYRQLAAGLTTLQLQQSPSPLIGGQSAIIKLRWGETAQGLLFRGADSFITLNLGAETRSSAHRHIQSRLYRESLLWDPFVTLNLGAETRSSAHRHTQSRLYRESLLQDAFLSAQEYGKTWTAYQKKKKGPQPRRDLQLEALWEVLQQKRFINCHIQRPSDMDVIASLVDRFKIGVNTFTHLANGYQISHQVPRQKLGTWDPLPIALNAMPYTVALMHHIGLSPSISSHEIESGLLLKQAAAQSITYGGLTEEEAWKSISLNSARNLGLSDRIGSMALGKDADLVLWSDHPLSVYAKVEKTFIDGRLYYDLFEAEKKQKEIQKEKQRIIHQVLIEEMPQKTSSLRNESTKHGIREKK